MNFRPKIGKKNENKTKRNTSRKLSALELFSHATQKCVIFIVKRNQRYLNQPYEFVFLRVSDKRKKRTISDLNTTSWKKIANNIRDLILSDLWFYSAQVKHKNAENMTAFLWFLISDFCDRHINEINFFRKHIIRETAFIESFSIFLVSFHAIVW